MQTITLLPFRLISNNSIIQIEIVGCFHRQVLAALEEAEVVEEDSGIMEEVEAVEDLVGVKIEGGLHHEEGDNLDLISSNNSLNFDVVVSISSHVDCFAFIVLLSQFALHESI